MPTILCTSPDAEVVRELRKLDPAGNLYDVACLRDLDVILQTLISKSFDLYVIDGNVFGVGKLTDICRAIRCVDEDGAIIGVAKRASDKEHMLECGADLFLKMPDSLNILRKTVDDLLRSEKGGISGLK